MCELIYSKLIDFRHRCELVYSIDQQQVGIKVTRGQPHSVEIERMWDFDGRPIPITLSLTLTQALKNQACSDYQLLLSSSNG